MSPGTPTRLVLATLGSRQYVTLVFNRPCLEQDLPVRAPGGEGKRRGNHNQVCRYLSAIQFRKTQIVTNRQHHRAGRRSKTRCDRAAGYDGIGLTEDVLAVVKPEQMHLVIASQPLAIGPVHQACVIDAVRNAGVKRDGTTDQPYTMPGSLSRKKPLQGAVAIRLPNSELVRILLAHQTKVFRKQNQSRPLLGSLL